MTARQRFSTSAIGSRPYDSRQSLFRRSFSVPPGRQIFGRDLEVIEHHLGIAPIGFEVDIEQIAKQWHAPADRVHSEIAEHLCKRGIRNAEPPSLIDNHQPDKRTAGVANTGYEPENGIGTKAYTRAWNPECGVHNARYRVDPPEPLQTIEIIQDVVFIRARRLGNHHAFSSDHKARVAGPSGNPLLVSRFHNLTVALFVPISTALDACFFCMSLSRNCCTLSGDMHQVPGGQAGPCELPQSRRPKLLHGIAEDGWVGRLPGYGGLLKHPARPLL
jgi:hypothetical protein